MLEKSGLEFLMWVHIPSVIVQGRFLPNDVKNSAGLRLRLKSLELAKILFGTRIGVTISFTGLQSERN